ncbi:MAG: polysaccharide biosynthesis/export family protein, partial [Pseudomonadota bacterium]|nr:polysaccharide biosynthesis/export family protein [Pseudomonadota bacterium]
MRSSSDACGQPMACQSGNFAVASGEIRSRIFSPEKTANPSFSGWPRMKPFSFDRSVMSALRLLIAMLCCAVVLSGCMNTRGGTVPYDRKDFGQPDVQTIAAPDSGKIGALDTLGISVFQLPDMTRDAAVDAAGNVVLPLLGTLHAEGKTPDQFAKEIAAQLAAKYVRQPDVEVVIKQSSAQTITVEGAVQNPGVFPITPGTTLI